ncbi:MAG TPA: hypothetical protein VG815_10955 [Chloroflexota bacterium]|jgi:hypothetical protein|nr:hypothetical protein [Chloroflexota bacterium]
MKLRLTVLLLACAAALSSILPVSAGVYRPMYNTASNAYSSFQNIAMAHNKYVKHPHGSCGGQKSRWWPGKAKSDMLQIAALSSRLAKMTNKQREKPAYHDLLQTVHDLKGWSGAWIMPRLLRCKSMPTSSSPIALDLTLVARDVGLGIY